MIYDPEKHYDSIFGEGSYKEALRAGEENFKKREPYLHAILFCGEDSA